VGLRSTGLASYGDVMRYEVLLNDGSVEVIDQVDGYAPDGCLTTFFTVEHGRAIRLDPWAVRVMSLRTDRVVRIASAACQPAAA
jgi:hypothetical protein